MVERPIKKSERQSQANADGNPENSDSMPPVESNPKSLKRRDERSSSKGKKSFADESRPPTNPALARGPKPVKPPANVVVEPETESEPTSEEPQN
jgi:hypothetical protein